jgi:acetyltransferase
VIAIVGASPTREKTGGRPLHYLDELGFTGRVLLINPAHAVIGNRTCYPSIAAIPSEAGGDEIDVALIAVQAERVPNVIEDCGARGVQFVVVFSAGFAETGEVGEQVQQQIAASARSSGVRLIGPNSQGPVGVSTRAICTFATSFEGLHDLHDGPVGFITQSGALGAFFFRAAQEQAVGLRCLVSTGNESDLDFADYVAHFAADPKIQLIAGYLEGVADGPKLLAALQLAQRAGKPVCLLKVGRSDRGAAAAVSHTASLTGSDALYNAVFSQTGVVRVDSLQDLLDIAGLWNSALRPYPDRGVAIATISGGLGVWLADAFAERDLRLSDLGAASLDRLRTTLPDFGHAANPIDVTGQIASHPALLRASLEAIVDDQDVGALVIGLGLQQWHGRQLADDIIAALSGRDLLVVVAWMAGPVEARERLMTAGVPVYDEYSRAVRAMVNVFKCTQSITTVTTATRLLGPPTQQDPPRHLKDGTVYDEANAKEALAASGISIPENRVVAPRPDTVLAAARDLGFPVVLKGLAPGYVHKSEHGLVAVDIRDAAALTEALTHMLRGRSESDDERPERLLVEQMVPDSVEVILSVADDPIFGISTMIGAGGILTNLTADVAHHVGKLDHTTAMTLITHTRISGLLNGYRGKQAVDTTSVAEAAVRLYRFVAESNGTIREVEINPLLVGPRGAVAADALIRRRVSYDLLPTSNSDFRSPRELEDHT